MKKELLLAPLCSLIIISASLNPCIAQIALETDINPGSGLSDPYYLATYQDKIFFSATDGINDDQLWSYNGNQVQLEAEDNGSLGLIPKFLTVYQDKLYFNGRDDTHGSELWSYDGLNATLVEDIIPGSGSSSPKHLIVFNDKLYFWGGNFSNGYELFQYDGINVVMIWNGAAGSASFEPNDEFAVFDGKLYFQANDGISGEELWSYDGNQVSLVADINLGQENSNPIRLTIYNSKLYFWADDGVNGSELWVFDGITASLAADINPGPYGTSIGIGMSEFNGKLYFGVWDPLSGGNLWSYDGNQAQIEAGSFAFYPFYPIEYAGKLYFSAVSEPGSSFEWNLWSFDGTNSMVESQIDHVSDTESFRKRNPIIYNDRLFLYGYNETYGSELWSFYDSTLGSEEHPSKQPLSIYPNPTSGTISLDVKSTDSPITLKVYNSVGEMISCSTINGGGQHEYNLTGSSGIYLFQLLELDGDVSTVRVIKE